MSSNAKGGVGLQEFVAAVHSGPSRHMLRSLVRKLRLGYNFGFRVPKGYDYSRPTHGNYAADGWDFLGDFAELRQTRNYGLHVNYTPERQRWQDEAIKSVITRVTTSANYTPWLVFTCGPMGVGKGYALSWMSKHGFFPLENIVHVEHDGFKMMMPEWPGYVERDRETAGTMTHRESCYMVEIAQAAAMQKRQNIWVDGSLRNAEFYAGEFEDIRNRFPHYRISIFYVEADEATIRARIKHRAQITGRDVPEHLIVDSLQAMDRVLKTLTPLCDFVARINNEGSVPVLTAFETINTSGCWSLIKERFAQQRDSICDFPQALAPLPLVRLPDEHLALLRAGDGPTGLQLLLGEAEGNGLQGKLRALLPPVTELATTPRFRVTLSDFARKLAMIPRRADSCMWVYPHPACSEEPAAVEQVVGPYRLWKSQLRALGFTSEEQTDPLVQLLFEGGFCYLDDQGALEGVSAVSHRGEPTVLQFGEPSRLSEAASAAMPPGRFRRVTKTYLRERGARNFAWVLPGEHFTGSDVGGRDGAMVYELEGGSKSLLRFPVVQD